MDQSETAGGRGAWLPRSLNPAPPSSPPPLLSRAQERRAAEKAGSGPELLSYVLARPAPSEDAARHMAWQLLSVLMALHERSPPFVHRDLKPENVSVWREVVVLPSSPSPPADAGSGSGSGAGGSNPPSSSGALRVPCLKLMDFGLARDLTSGEGEVNVLTENAGTGFYTAPEVLTHARGEKGYARYGTPCDVYSLAALLVAVLTKSSPTRHVHLGQDAAARKRLAGRGVGEDGLALLALMSAKDPAARPTARQCLQHAWFDPVRETAADAFGDRTLLDVMA
jgi:serine/threonine protein kinase